MPPPSLSCQKLWNSGATCPTTITTHPHARSEQVLCSCMRAQSAAGVRVVFLCDTFVLDRTEMIFRLWQAHIKTNSNQLKPLNNLCVLGTYSVSTRSTFSGTNTKSQHPTPTRSQITRYPYIACMCARRHGRNDTLDTYTRATSTRTDVVISIVFSCCLVAFRVSLSFPQTKSSMFHPAFRPRAPPPPSTILYFYCIWHTQPLDGGGGPHARPSVRIMQMNGVPCDW